MFKKGFHFLGGIAFAIALIGAVLVFVIGGTFIESATESHGFAARFTYGSPFFLALLLGFFVNILFAALRRWPFRRKHIPFLTTHLGLLMILSGTMIKSMWGIQGAMALTEGCSSNEIFLPRSYALSIETRHENETLHTLIPINPKKMGEIPSPLSPLKLEITGYTPHVKEELSAQGSILAFDKGYAGYGVLDSEEILPLTRKILPEKPHRKLEDLVPSIILTLSEGGRQEKIALAYDRFALGLKWPALGTYLVRFQSMKKNLPYRVRLREARQINYPLTGQPFSYESDILINGETEATLSMNNVYEAGDGTRFYLANLVAPPENGAKRVQIVANRDPAKYWLTYPGAVFVSAGIILLLFFHKRFL